VPYTEPGTERNTKTYRIAKFIYLLWILTGASFLMLPPSRMHTRRPMSDVGMWGITKARTQGVQLSGKNSDTYPQPSWRGLVTPLVMKFLTHSPRGRFGLGQAEGARSSKRNVDLSGMDQNRDACMTGSWLPAQDPSLEAAPTLRRRQGGWVHTPAPSRPGREK
jgi:hypothetical protein